jgi:hypothetical protein
MRSARARDHVGVELIPPPLGITGLRLRVFDPDSERPPEPLRDVSAAAPEALSLEDLRKQGGPSLAQLRDRIEGKLQTGDLETAAELFNQLPDDLRRPVEILGLLHLFTGMSATFDVERELVRAIRPDGSTRQFLMPAATIEQSVPVAPDSIGAQIKSTQQGDAQ